MEDILNFLEAIFNFITSLVDFVISFIGDLLYVITLTGEYLIHIPDYFAWLPGEMVALIVTLFSIVVIYKVLGREG